MAPMGRQEFAEHECGRTGGIGGHALRLAGHPNGAPTRYDQLMPHGLEIVVADITTLDVDAIVNAANSALSGGGGVDGAIHRAAGPELAPAARAAGRAGGGCPPGGAVMTPGFRLPARHVIHAVGPVWRDGDHGEDALLASCYSRSLELAGSAGLASIAFPAISTGIFGFPRERAARIAIATVTDEAPRHQSLKRVIFCCFSERDAAIYRATSG